LLLGRPVRRSEELFFRLQQRCRRLAAQPPALRTSKPPGMDPSSGFA
jgi:hypothetical protein